MVKISLLEVMKIYRLLPDKTLTIKTENLKSIIISLFE